MAVISHKKYLIGASPYMDIYRARLTDPCVGMRKRRNPTKGIQSSGKMVKGNEKTDKDVRKDLLRGEESGKKAPLRKKKGEGKEERGEGGGRGEENREGAQPKGWWRAMLPTLNRWLKIYVKAAKGRPSSWPLDVVLTFLTFSRPRKNYILFIAM